MQDKIIEILDVSKFTSKAGKEFTKTKFVTETGKTANTLDTVKVNDMVNLKNSDKFGWQGKKVKENHSTPASVDFETVLIPLRAIYKKLSDLEIKLDKLSEDLNQIDPEEEFASKQAKEDWDNLGKDL